MDLDIIVRRVAGVRNLALQIAFFRQALVSYRMPVVWHLPFPELRRRHTTGRPSGFVTQPLVRGHLPWLEAVRNRRSTGLPAQSASRRRSQIGRALTQAREIRRAVDRRERAPYLLGQLLCRSIGVELSKHLSIFRRP